MLPCDQDSLGVELLVNHFEAPSARITCFKPTSETCRMSCATTWRSSARPAVRSVSLFSAFPSAVKTARCGTLSHPGISTILLPGRSTLTTIRIPAWSDWNELLSKQRSHRRIGGSKLLKSPVLS